MRKSAFCAALAVAAIISTGSQALGGHFSKPREGQSIRIVSLVVENYQADMRRLVEMDVSIAGVDLENNTIDVIVTKEEFELLTITFGYKVSESRIVNPEIAPDPNYTTSAELAVYMRGVAEAHPGIVRLHVIGHSNENREILALKITDNPEERELDEPTVLFNSMHHSREVMTTEVAMDIIDQLVTLYGTDADITRWVDSTEIWIVPMLNPDGNNKVWTGDSMWRKNTRGGHGVDINRNYPYRWNSCNGSSGSTWSDTYRGPAPASEPETQALMNLVAQIEPVFDISYHSYSELVIYPFGCNGARTPTRDIVEGIGRTLASKLPRDSGNGTYSPGTAWELLYSVDGGDIDWMYDEYHVIPYVLEINASRQGFQPAYSWRNPTVQKMRNGWRYLLDRVHQTGIRGTVADASGRMAPGTVVKVEGLGTSTVGTINWKIKNDGTYHIVLQPGMYRLTFTLNDRVQTREVTIGADVVVEDIEI